MSPSFVSGIAGANSGAITPKSVTIKSCFNTGDININNARHCYVCGVGSSGTIKNCYNTGSINVESSNAYLEGIGGNYVINCYNNGNIIAVADSEYGQSFCSGISMGSAMTNCYNTGNIKVATWGESPSYAGGIYAGESSPTITNCYNIGEVVSLAYSASLTNIGSISSDASSTVKNSAYLNASQTSSSETVNGNSTTGYKLPKSSGASSDYKNGDGTTLTNQNMITFLTALLTVSPSNPLKPEYFSSSYGIWATEDSSGNDISWDSGNWEVDAETGNLVLAEPILTATLLITNATQSNALLFITSESEQTFTYYVKAGNNTINVTLPSLSLDTTYKICVYNATLSGTLSESNGNANVAITNSTYYSFLCTGAKATITLSGLTISN